MDNFNITKYFKKQYITEALNLDKYDKITDQYQKELKSMGVDYNTFVSMRDYSQEGRSKGDKYLGRGFGDIHFNYRDEIPSDDFSKAIKFLKDKGFDIVSDSNYYEVEWDNDRAWYPKIKFEFDIEKAEELLKEGKLNELHQKAADLVDGYELEDLERNLKQLYSDMEQEAEPEGGPISDQYADEIHFHEEAIRFIKNKGKEQAQLTYGQAIGQEEITDETGTYTMGKNGVRNYIKINPITRDEFEKSSKFDRNLNEVNYPTPEIELRRLGIKYELSGNKNKPIEKVFKPIDKSDDFYRKFDDVVDRYGLANAVVEGSCGYSVDGEKKDKPAGPHLIKLEKMVKEIYSNQLKGKNNKK
jgi:hypothetical protein